MCGYPERQGIGQALATQEPYRDIAGRFGTSKSALHRHRYTHAPGPSSPDDRLALSAEAWRLHAAAFTLSYHPVGVLALLQGITWLLVELTAGAVPPHP